MAKRRRVDLTTADDAMLCGSVGSHPLGVQPKGNLLALLPPGVEAARVAHHRGLGQFGRLPETLLLELLQRLPPQYLARLAATSTFMRVYATHNDLWRPHVLERIKRGEAVVNLGSGWHSCFVASLTPFTAGHPATNREGTQIRCSTPLYSDVLYAPWVLTAAAYPSTWTDGEDVPRASGLTAAQFKVTYELPNQPVVMTDWTTGWGAHERWTPDSLSKTHPHAMLEVFDDYAGPMSLQLSSYLEYARHCADERPLYLFDRAFCEKGHGFEHDYAVPEAMSDDLFSVLGDARPDYKWLLLGPRGSGAAFHQDPNGTSAWNAVISGRKKWILFPPGVTPPGVHSTGDVDASSVVDWFHQYFVQIEGAVSDRGGIGGGDGPWQCVVHPGEVLYIPRGWWHMALNLDLTVAVTHNLAAPSSVGSVLEFLHDHQDQACPSTALMAAGNRGHEYNLHDEFLAALQTQRPDVLPSDAELRRIKPRAAVAREGGAGSTPFAFNFG